MVEIIYRNTWTPEMNLVDITTKQPVKLAGLEERMKAILASAKDNRIIKPNKMYLSDLKKGCGGEGLSESYEEDVRNYNGKMIYEKILETEPLKDGFIFRYDAEFEPVIPKERKLYHEASPHYFIGNGLELLAKKNAWGNIDPKEVTYLKFADVSSEEGAGNSMYLFENGDHDKPHRVNMAFEIDRDKLLETRNIFRDPDGLICNCEFEGTFLVFGGIPYQAITDFKMEVF